MRLLCLPHAGSGITPFRAWNAGLPEVVQVCSVLLPGRERRSQESLFTEFEPLVDTIDRELRPWLDLPYAVFGHSMGALLAFEWVRRLRNQGQAPPAWLFLSGRRAPEIFPDPIQLHSLPDAQFLSELSRLYQGIPQEFLGDPDFMEVFLPILRADIAVVESYRFRTEEPLSCPMTVFAGVSDPSVTWEQMLAWKQHTRGRFSIRVLPGGHFYPQESLLQTISAALTALNP